jgi:hypothetical protein
MVVQGWSGSVTSSTDEHWSVLHWAVFTLTTVGFCGLPGWIVYSLVWFPGNVYDKVTAALLGVVCLIALVLLHAMSSVFDRSGNRK